MCVTVLGFWYLKSATRWHEQAESRYIGLFMVLGVPAMAAAMPKWEGRTLGFVFPFAVAHFATLPT